MKKIVLLFSFLSAPAFAANPCQGFEGTWVYKGREADGFETLKLSIHCDSKAPLPDSYQEWARGKEMPLRGFLSFDADGYGMGPFPFASVVESAASLEAQTSRLKTHYFYTYTGEDGFQYEDFDLELREGQLLLYDMEECDTGLCEVKYTFQITNPRLPL